jgi:hypothetical protein
VANLLVVGYVTEWYQSFWFKHQTGMGRNECELGKFVVADFGLSEFGEKWWKIREKIPKFVSRFEFK